MSAYSKFRVDPELEKNGVVIDYEDFRVTLARAGGNNKRFQKVAERNARPFQRALQTETMDNAKADDLLKETYAETVILDWEVRDENGEWKRGIEDPDSGETLSFSKENVLRVLRHKQLGDIWGDLRANATKAALYRASIEEARLGN